MTIRDLDPEEKDLLDVAACCGFEFDPSLVASAVGLARIPALKRLARIEQQHRLIRSTGRVYAFDHHQVQEALYAGMHETICEDISVEPPGVERDPFGSLGGWAHFTITYSSRSWFEVIR